MTTLPEIRKAARQLMLKAVENTQRELASIRSSRATTSLLDIVRVDAYGQQMPLNQVATVAAPEARLLTVQPWDRSLVGAVEKAILTSDLGLNPSNDGTLIRIPLPPLTEERRKELVKMVKKMAEESKVALRGARREANEMLKEFQKDKEITEDEEKQGLKKVQDATDAAVVKVDEIVAKKEKEILEV
jgi:ribosome recycling factor